MRRPMWLIVPVASAAVMVAAGLAAPFALAVDEPAAVTPSAPFALLLDAPSATEVYASWSEPTSDGGSPVTDYVVERRAFGESSWTPVPRDPSSATEAALNELSPATAYAVRVAAVNGEGTGPWNVDPTTIDTGLNHACAVLSDGAAACWGRNADGQLGNGSTLTSPTPVPVDGIDGFEAGRTAVAIAAGETHSCVALADGAVACWGGNSSGQLGNGTTGAETRPVPVSGLSGGDGEPRAVAISAGGSHTCALLSTGAVKCWGMGGEGQLGAGTQSMSAEPVDVIGLDGQSPAGRAMSLSAGYLHTCAVLQTGAVKCWGSNYFRQLGGEATPAFRTWPTQVPGLSGVDASSSATSVSAGYDSSCVIMASGGVQCWGMNASGQLGDGTVDTSGEPVDVVGLDGSTAAKTVVNVAAGFTHTCAVLATGTAACWGSGNYGQLGGGEPAASRIPAAVAVFTGQRLAVTTVAVAAGQGFTCAVVANGSARCWGVNDSGQLGSGYGANQATPTPVTNLDGSPTARKVGLGSVVATLPAQPGPPTFTSAVATSTSTIELTWSAPGDDGGADITDYQVEYRIVGAPGDLTWITVPHDPTPATSMTVGSLTSGATYAFRVAAITSAGVGAWSDESESVRTLRLPGAPGTPVVVTRSPTTITVRWSEAPANGSAVTLYLVQSRAGSGSWVTLSRDDAQSRTATFTNLRPGTSYTFRVRAGSAAGDGPWSSVSTPVVAAGKPGVPGSLTATPTKRAGQLLVTWTAAAANGAPPVRYEVSWRGRGEWSTPVRAEGRSYLISGLAKGVYSVRVTAITVEGSTSAIRGGVRVLK